MGSDGFIQDLAVVLLAAGLAAVVCHRWNMPKVLGYIFAGFILGPHTPPFSLVRNEDTIHLLANLGVIFLMFSLGMEFNLRRIRKAGAAPALIALLDVAVMIWLGYQLGRGMGWSLGESLFLGGLMCDSSTTIVAKTIQEMGRARDRFAGIVISTTVVEDLLAVGVMAVLTGVAVTGRVQAHLVALRMWELVLFLVVVLVVGLLFLPRLLNYLARKDNDELLVVSTLGLCFAIVLLSIQLELSLALGAVLVGVLASESRAVHRIEPLVDPLRHLFGAVFFVAIGMLLDPRLLLEHRWTILAVSLVIVAGKLGTNILGALFTGHDLPTALRSGAGMAQVGEFALIIASLGLALGASGDRLYQIGVGASVLTTLANPFLMRAADRWAAALERREGTGRWAEGFRLYSRWVERIRRSNLHPRIRETIRRSILIVGLNLVLIAAVIAGADHVARAAAPFLPRPAAWPGLLEAVLWVLAMLICLPLYVATIRKLNALGMVLSEVSVPSEVGSAWARAVRAFIAYAILVAGSTGMGLMTLMLSSALLPSWWILLVLVAGLAGVLVWQWTHLIRAYARAQNALTRIFSETTERPAAVHPVSAPVPTASAAHLPMQVERVIIPTHSPLVGRTLRTAGLRSRTGATVVGIERAGEKRVNPRPDERFHAGDCIYVLGHASQIEAMRTFVESVWKARSSRDSAGL